MALAARPTVLLQPNGSSIRADALAYGVSRMPCCAAVDGRALGFCRHMRRHVHESHFVDEVFGVVSLIGAKRDADSPVRPIGVNLCLPVEIESEF